MVHLARPVIKDGHDPLKAPLLTLGDILPGRSGRCGVQIEPFEDMIRGDTGGRGSYKERLPRPLPFGSASP